MILSSINFIKTSTKPKLETDKQFTDFIIEKIKEEQDRRDAAVGVLTSPCCKKNEKCHMETKVPSRVPTHIPDVSENTVVSIETGDGYFFGVHNMYNRLVLSDTETPNKNCIFRQKQIKHTENEGEKEKLMVAFHLNHDKTKYISVGTDKRIEISAKETDLDPSNPDDRFFVIHQIDNGMVFIQPHHHKGCYFHHIDNELTVSKFELNYRPPEEFLFKINTINILETEISSASSLGSSITTEEVTQSHLTHHHQQNSVRKGIPRLQKSERNSSKHTNKPSLFLGCFGLVSKEEKRHKHKC